MTSAPPIGFDYRPSRVLLAVTLAVLVLAVLAVARSGLPLSLRLALPSLLVLLAGWRLRRFLHPPLRALLWRADGGVTVTLHAGGETEAELLEARVLGPLVAMELRWRGRHRVALWLLPDNLEAGLRRRLRVRILAQPGRRDDAL